MSIPAARSRGEGLFCVLGSPLGPIYLEEDEKGISALYFTETLAQPLAPPEGSRWLRPAGEQLRDYFAGARKGFDLPLSLRGTDFQLRVWEALRNIPYGETRSYQEIAAALGNEKASRAVGMANRRNSVWILIPCHRVVGKDGSLTGYAGGLERKEALLRLEQANRDTL